MLSAIIFYWLRPGYIVNSVLLALFLGSITLGCAFIPEQEQLVYAKVDKPLSRSNGRCTETALASSGAEATSPLAELPSDSISILNWNIYKGNRTGWKNDFLRLSRKKDIILLQEAPFSHELQQLLRQNNLHWTLNSAFSYAGLETGVLIASTIEPLGSCGMRSAEPITGLPKTTLINRYAISGSSDELLVATVHGINFTLDIDAYKLQFQALADILQNHRGPLLIAGDFNNWSNKRTVVIDFLAKDLSLSILPFENNERTTFFGTPVDHVFYRGLEPIARAVHSVASSDHNPLSVIFRLAEGQAVTKKQN